MTSIYNQESLKGLVGLVCNTYKFEQHKSSPVPFTLLLLHRETSYNHFLLLYQPKDFTHFERIDAVNLNVYHIFVREHRTDFPKDLESVFFNAFDDWKEQEVRIG